MLWTHNGARRAAIIGAFALGVAACAPAASSPPGGGAPAKPGALPTPNPTAVAEGQVLIGQKGCAGCHIIPGIPGATGTVGPNLTGVATRESIAGGAVMNNGPDDIKRWILDPPSIKPGTQMPKLGLTDDEATKITAYLETLR
jgi:cytochrome c